MKDSPNLDLLRSVAVGLVVVNHFRFFFPLAPEYIPVSDALGFMGVSIFFVHTTLVLMLSMERNGAAAVPFFIRRFFRIYPLAVVAVLLSAGVLAMRGPIDGGALLANLLLVQNITGHPSNPTPLWSLPYEVQMYLVLPLLYAATKTKRPVLSVALLCVASPLLVLLAMGLFNLQVVRLVPCFLPGVLAFVLIRREPKRSPLVLFSVVGIAALVIPPLVASGVSGLPLHWALCLVLGLTIPLCREITNASLAKCAKVVATYSYGLYLTHMAAMGLAFNVLRDWPAVVQWSVFLIALPVLSYAAYRWIEAPGIRLGQWLASNTHKQQAAPKTKLPPLVS